MPNSWQMALTRYQYPVDLSKFADSAQFSQWFSFPLSIGNLAETMAFEEHFRSHARSDLESWYEVVFWKMFSQGGRANIQTRVFIAHATGQKIEATSLARLCEIFVREPNRETFKRLHAYLGYSQSSMAVTATFPAFMDPKHFPMVDRRVAKWIHECGATHNHTDRTGPQLLDPGVFSKNRTNLQMRDFDFYESWIHWCRHTAKKLTARTRTEWRARDIEMAIFYAWGDSKPHPSFHLNPLSSVPAAEEGENSV